MDLVQLAAFGFFVLGLLIGSFLNVVIHRLPIMLERAWEQEYKELQGETAQDPPAFNLMVPRSRCPHCSHAITWYENIPLVSYLALRGRCSACQKPISPRYPLVELSTGLLFAWCGHRWGLSISALAWSGFAASLVALTLIDWDTTLLPDDITLPLVWAGLVAAHWGISGVALPSALWGAIAGYLSLWSVYWLFKLATGKEGMGYGDFKLLAGLGAWFGWEALLPIILMSSIIGAVVGIALKLNSKLREGGYIPFGPFLAGAGLVTLILGTGATRHLIGI
ncbi:MAG: prepilin peptidase [Rhodoferax sp.]|nr:MAG: prepilin peptidase [Rhodoferax sp.]